MLRTLLSLITMFTLIFVCVGSSISPAVFDNMEKANVLI